MASKVILLTPPGAAAIAVVRLTGEAAREFLRAHFSKEVREGRPVHAILADGDRVIDDPVVVVHERGVDLSIHGGPWVVRSVLELARRNGFESGDWADGVDGDEAEREMLAVLPQARTKLALRCLLGSRRWRDSNFSPPEWIARPPRVAIVGGANVGKSTIANQLFAQKRSITADVPGTTRDWVGEIADVDGVAVFLIDTPGMRATSDEIERVAIEQSRGEIAGADLVVLVIDAMESVEAQGEWVAKYPGALVVRNKCDRAENAEAISQSLPHVYTVATTGEGIDSLRQAIRRRFVQLWRVD